MPPNLINMRRFFGVLFLIAIIISPFSMFSVGITSSQLIQYGANAFQQRSHRSEVLIQKLDFIVEEDDTLIAVFNFENGGFLLLSADDAAIPVIGYSLENEFFIDNIAPAAREWVAMHEREILYIKKNHVPASETTRELWDEIMASNTKSYNRSVMVAPLLKSTWNQNKYYNVLCPADANSPEGYDGHVPNGCVALAMASVMHYYRYPEQGLGNHSYHSNYGVHTVNFTQQYYCYDAMPFSLNNYNNEVAKLIYQSGVSVNMDYAIDGSGAQTGDAAYAMQSHFRYDSDISAASRNTYNTNSWIELLKNNIDAQHPIIYSGYSEEGGHAFVCDGYDSDNNFHFNWGWGGHGNGFFTVANNVEGSVGGYSSWQGIVHSIYPPDNAYPEYCPQNNPITAVSGIIEDGSGIYNYQNNTNCTYIIAPEDATLISLSVLDIETEQGVDTLTIWDGDPNNGGNYLATFSGNVSNPDNWILSRSGMMYLTFKTNGETTGAGWQVSFMAQRSVRCVGTTRYTEAYGSFNDGSEESEYASNANCIWRIEPEGATYVNLYFDQFDLSPEDNVLIYDDHALDANILGTYTGSTLPSTIHSSTGKMKVVFRSDNYMQKNGFAAQWNSDGAGMSENQALQQFEIFPNPTSNELFVTLPGDFQHGKIRVCEMSGKEIILKDITTSNSTYKLDTQSLPAGIYLLSICNEKLLLSKKLIIQR